MIAGSESDALHRVRISNQASMRTKRPDQPRLVIWRYNWRKHVSLIVPKNSFGRERNQRAGYRHLVRNVVVSRCVNSIVMLMLNRRTLTIVSTGNVGNWR